MEAIHEEECSEMCQLTAPSTSSLENPISPACCPSPLFPCPKVCDELSKFFGAGQKAHMQWKHYIHLDYQASDFAVKIEPKAPECSKPFRTSLN